MNWAYWLNTGWMLACAPAARKFHEATRDVARTQADLLREMLDTNRDTAIGRQFDFASLRDPMAFLQCVPLATYETYADAVGRIAQGEPNVLTREPVTLLEPTSGSTSGEKLIPYTTGLRKQFQAGIAPWIANLLHQRPGLRNGRAYWSISPALGQRHTTGGIPIGFDDDTAYLGLAERLAVSHILATPPTLSRISDLDEFRYATLLHLLRADDLALISIWSPTFLTALLHPLKDWLDRLCHDIQQGGHDLPAEPRRAEAVMHAWRTGGVRAIWPNLQLISCWADAGAALHVPPLRALFPQVEVQPKGLIATEAFVSLPLVDQDGAALSVRSHFFEFQEADGRCRLAHEVERGGRYRVVVTTAGGLYRYQLRDEVEIVGFVEQCPLVRFLGKADLVSDLCGEKLAEPFVRAALERLWHKNNARPRFQLLVPVQGAPPRYRLYVQRVPEAGAWQGDLQAELEQNPHYRYAIGLGQLAAVEIRVLNDEVDGWTLYEAGCVARGRKLGNIKPTAIDVRFGWEKDFELHCTGNQHTPAPS